MGSCRQAVLLLHLAGFTTISRDLVLPGTAAMGPLRQARWFWIGQGDAKIFRDFSCQDMPRINDKKK